MTAKPTTLGELRASGYRRRPVKIDFCEADVLDVFDEWRRALGLRGPQIADEASPAGDASSSSSPSSSSSLPRHLERVIVKLSNARARGTLSDAFDALIDQIAAELDAAKSTARGLRGDARQALLARLDALDRALGDHAGAALDAASRRGIERDADEELAAYRATMAPEAFARARAAAIDRLVRQRFGLPIVRFM